MFPGAPGRCLRADRRRRGEGTTTSPPVLIPSQGGGFVAIDMTKLKGRIERWACVCPKNEDEGVVPIRIYGVLVGSGSEIVTSAVEEVEGKVVRTRSGSVYELGDVDPAYLAEMKANKYPFDPEHPIKVLGPEAKRRTRFNRKGN
jgi:hypothetical protein